MRFESIASGSSGNCVYVGSERTHLLVDAGISRRRTSQALHDIGLDWKEINGIFLTHEHSDHIAGLPVIAKNSSMPIYATRGTIDAVRRSPKCREIDPDRFVCIRPDEPVRVGDLEIEPMRISHDAAEPVGYRVYEGRDGSEAVCRCSGEKDPETEEKGRPVGQNGRAEPFSEDLRAEREYENQKNGPGQRREGPEPAFGSSRKRRVKKACICTDLGCYTPYTQQCLMDSDILLLESNHDVNMLQVGGYPYRLKQRILGECGHLSNSDSGRLLSSVLNDHLKGIFLGHLSKENNYPELAFETVRVEILFSGSGYRPEELPICVAKRDAPSGLVEL